MGTGGGEDCGKIQTSIDLVDFLPVVSCFLTGCRPSPCDCYVHVRGTVEAYETPSRPASAPPSTLGLSDYGSSRTASVIEVSREKLSDGEEEATGQEREREKKDDFVLRED